jgi:anti-sigma factor RsiW
MSNNTCNHATDIHAFHDGQLSAQMRDEVGSHLAECEPCRNLLADLQRMSAMFAAAPLPEMPQGGMNRLEQSWWRRRGSELRIRDHAIRQMTAWLTSAAAAVLAVGLLHMQTSAPVAADAHVDPWEMAAATTTPDQMRDDSNSAQIVQVAQWMSQDLSLGQRTR